MHVYEVLLNPHSDNVRILSYSDDLGINLLPVIILCICSLWGFFSFPFACDVLAKEDSNSLPGYVQLCSYLRYEVNSRPFCSHKIYSTAV